MNELSPWVPVPGRHNGQACEEGTPAFTLAWSSWLGHDEAHAGSEAPGELQYLVKTSDKGKTTSAAFIGGKASI